LGLLSRTGIRDPKTGEEALHVAIHSALYLEGVIESIEFNQ